jgi:beta-galactosidase/beta-glucuronidase
MSVPRAEHPRPQFQRRDWMNLNGRWQCAFDFGLSGDQRDWPKGLPTKAALPITVPFCPESRLSGVAHTDFIPAIWYQRSFAVPSAWTGQRVLLHFGAVDYDCRAWINGQLVGRHLGGAASFTFDISAALQPGTNQLVVCAQDDTRSALQPGGKQSSRWASHGCVYTRTTGIWQTVWLESVPTTRLDQVRIVPDVDGGRLVVTPVFRGPLGRHRFRATLLDGDRPLTTVHVAALNGGTVSVVAPSPRLWSPADPYLYELRLELLDGDQVVDTVASYAGLRQLSVDGNRLLLNGQSVFLRFVLDQGFYPEGIWTAPDDADLKGDITRSLAVGFNGARLHQKVFEERFHYWADRLGYLTWGEYCDWGMDFAQPQGVRHQQREWREVVGRDLNHPSILTWTPFNETAGHAQADAERHRRVIQETCDLTRALDPTRPLNDASGYVHVDTDIFTVHDYDQDVAAFRQRYAPVDPAQPDKAFVCCAERSIPYTGQPYVVDEYGGTWWVDPAEREAAEQTSGWGYGNRPASIEEVYQRLEGLTAVLTGHPQIAGYTYTQLTDVEQERNGIYTYDRRPKFDAARLQRAFGAPAAIEER